MTYLQQKDMRRRVENLIGVMGMMSLTAEDKAHFAQLQDMCDAWTPRRCTINDLFEFNCESFEIESKSVLAESILGEAVESCHAASRAAKEDFGQCDVIFNGDSALLVRPDYTFSIILSLHHTSEPRVYQIVANICD